MPQLYLNYKLKSVAHLPWRQMTYKFLNTIIDDLFAFVIKMPLLHRISVFRYGCQAQAAGGKDPMYAVGRGGKMPHCVCIQAVSLPTGSRLIGRGSTSLFAFGYQNASASHQRVQVRKRAEPFWGVAGG